MRILDFGSHMPKRLLPVAVIAALLIAPSNAFAEHTTQAQETEDAEQTQEADAGTCQIDDAALQWGVKESFRSYISGTIANGDWETSDGADYETPNFLWTDGSGTYDPASGSGEVSFSGTVQFSGHDGVLDLSIANPTVEFEEGEASLLLDTRSTDMEGDVAIDDEQQWVGEVALDQEMPLEDGPVELTDLATTLTNSGAAAFAGFYEAGEALDPVTVSFEMANCNAAGDEAEPTEGADDEAADNQEPMIIPAPEIPWLALTLGGLALLVIGFTIGIFVGGRKPQTKRKRRSSRLEDTQNMDNLMGDR